MIQIQYVRVGPVVVAQVVNDDRLITTAFGFTQNHAAQRLIKKLQ